LWAGRAREAHLLSFFEALLSNKAIVIPVISWFTAQAMKVAGAIISERKLDFTRFVGSGGMPSSHSSLVVSLAVVIGKNYGWQSGLFAIALIFSLVVMYDAAGVRQAAGKQAKVLNKLIFSDRHNINVDEKLKELLGHTPFEVLMGALLGIFMGLSLG
jgi:acid phosphatase family membrane protein YuiD